MARRSGRLLIGVTLAAVAWSALAAAIIVRRIADGEPFENVVAEPLTVRVPPLVLTDQSGRRFDLRQQSGPVLVTFGFPHCETMCPMLVRDVLRIRRETAREDVPLVVVTVDPWRDDPSRLPSIAAAWQLASGDRVLSGNVAEVNAALDAWGVARQRDEATGEVVHALVTFLVHPGTMTASRVDASLEPLRSLLGDT